MKMEQGMQDYLKTIAIKIKVENFKEFGKSKEETVQALIKTFQLSNQEATLMVEKFWSDNPFIANGASSLIERHELFIQEKEKKIQEYDLAIQIVEDAINGYSVETIAKQKEVSIQKVKEILG
jgi:hypothetical protein